MISMILGLLLVVIVVRVIVGILVNPGILLRVVFGFALLVILGIASLAMLIGTFSARAAAHVSGVGMPGVTVSPMGVHVYSGTGKSVRVTPLGVEVNGRTTVSRRGTWTENGGTYREVDPASADANTIRGRVPVRPESVSPAGEANADTPVYSYRNTAEEEKQTIAEFRRVFRDYFELPSPATVAAESAVQAEAPEEPVASATVAEPQGLLAEHFDPDVYQSEGTAIRGLTGQVGKMLDSLTHGRRAPATIYIEGNANQFLAREMWKVLNKDFPFADVSFSKSTVKVSDDMVILAAWIEDQIEAEVPDLAAAVASPAKVLRIEAIGKEGKVSRSARFLDKPWVDDFATFASGNQERAWVMAMSRDPAVSVAEAEQQALGDAVAQIEPRVRDRLAHHVHGAADLLVQRQVRAGLESSGMIVDRFVQRFERPYGEIWQVGLLIDASPKKIAALAEKCDRMLAGQQRTFRQTVLSIAGLVALVCVVYIFLNSVTKGYFVWSLRAAALAILAGGVFLVLLLSHNSRPVIEGFVR